MNLDYDTLLLLKKSHPAWRLLVADHAPLIVSFLYRVFLSENIRDISQMELVAKLDDELFQLRELEGEEKFPRSAMTYIEEWSQDDKGWLRKFYPPGSDEPAYDITSATEKAIAWLEGLTTRKFVGTESRLRVVFDLLRQMIDGTEGNPDKRIIELQKKKREIDQEIDAIRAGKISRLSGTAVRDRAQQVQSTAMELLRDFREVENNFRQLDKDVREKIATWDGKKGELLDEIIQERDAISDSDQGRSFQAFWRFLISFDRQAELTEMLGKMMGFDAVQELELDPRLKHIHYDWLEASSHTQRTVAKLSQQLRRFLDDKTYLENRRIIDILQNIQTKAVEVRDTLPSDSFMEIDTAVAKVALPFERPPFSPPVKPIVGGPIEEADSDNIDANALFDQFVVDKEKLAGRIRQMVQGRDQVSLSEVLKEYPLEQGLAELVAYFSIASEQRAVFAEEHQEEITLQMDGQVGRRVRVPRIIFTR